MSHPLLRVVCVAFVSILPFAACDSASHSKEPAGEAGSGGQMGWTGVLSEEEFAALHEMKTTAAPALHGTTITLADGSSAYLSVPRGEPPFPALTVIHEWWGLNEHVKHWADRLAAAGYAALAVDLYGGQQATKPQDAMALMKAVDEAKAKGTLAAAHRFLAADERVRANKRGSIGWCFGGAWSLQMAIAEPDLDAAVIYYGRLVTDPEVLSSIRAPILGIFGKLDKGIPPAKVAEWEEAMMHSSSSHVQTVLFEANHAFANPSSARYDSKSAAQAWAQVQEFLRKYLRADR